MYKRVLLAVDLEGVNKVAGEPYMGLARDTDGWIVAKEQAAAEINAAAKALFAAGAEKVGVITAYAAVFENNIHSVFTADCERIFIQRKSLSTEFFKKNRKFGCSCHNLNLYSLC